MTVSREFCPRCGDPISSRPGADDAVPGGDAAGDETAAVPREREAALCDACYFEEFELVDAPDRLEVLVCAQCGAIKRGKRWVDVGARDYTDVAVEEVSEALGVHRKAEDVSWSVEPEQVDENTIRMHCRFSGVVRGTPITEERVVPVKFSKGSCPRCGRIAGGFYAGVVQVRATERTPTPEEQRRAVEIAETFVADREEAGDRDAFISEIDETPDGPDVKVSTNQLAKAIATRITRELGGSYESYPTLVTEDSSGDEVYRVTFAVRLPRFTSGDVIDPEDGDGPVLVRSVRGRLKGTRLASGADYEASFEEGETPDAQALGDVDDAVETTVVTVEDENAVQVLDPETYESTVIPRPDYFDPDAATVPVIKSRAGLHVLPPADADEHADAGDPEGT